MKRRFGAARIGHLATSDAAGRPHLVPVCFALDSDTAYFAVDAKPKRTRVLKRLLNIAANPRVSLLVDHYEEDWRRLWWVRADGTARIVDDEAQSARAVGLLQDRYQQYRIDPPGGPVVAIAIDGWSGWSAS